MCVCVFENRTEPNIYRMDTYYLCTISIIKDICIGYGFDFMLMVLLLLLLLLFCNSVWCVRWWKNQYWLNIIFNVQHSHTVTVTHTWVPRELMPLDLIIIQVRIRAHRYALMNGYKCCERKRCKCRSIGRHSYPKTCFGI